jgi:hypothetical protein
MLSQLLKSALLSKSTKLNLHRTLIRPVITYAAVTWIWKFSDENALRIFDRKIIRKIYDNFCEDGVCSVRSSSRI